MSDSVIVHYIAETLTILPDAISLFHSMCSPGFNPRAVHVAFVEEI
jgi:hypothetical protein